MNMMGKSVLFTGEVKTTDDVLEKIDNTSAQRVRELASEIFNSEDLALAVVGKIESERVGSIYTRFAAL
jgi:predicted Zn-dependent peptidase